MALKGPDLSHRLLRSTQRTLRFISFKEKPLRPLRLCGEIKDIHKYAIAN